MRMFMLYMPKSTLYPYAESFDSAVCSNVQLLQQPEVDRSRRGRGHEERLCARNATPPSHVDLGALDPQLAGKGTYRPLRFDRFLSVKRWHSVPSPVWVK